MKRKQNNVDLICDISELTNLFDRTVKIEDFLQSVVELIADHMHALVCSIYLFNQENQELTLRATVGLSADMIGTVKLNSGEGIVGTALKELRPILEEVAEKNPHYKYIPGSGEEKFKSFLAVPVLRGIKRIGVLVLEHEKIGFFGENDKKALKAIASQLASTIENAELLISLHNKDDIKNLSLKKTKVEQPGFIKGVSASDNIAKGLLYKASRAYENPFLKEIEYDEHPYTIDDFRQALQMTENQIKDLQKQMQEELFDVASLIFDAHFLILKDSDFSGKMEQLIEEGTPPFKAVIEVVDHFSSLFSESPNPRIKEKVQDIMDLGHRILANLAGDHGEHNDYSEHIVLCTELLPSEFIKLTAQKAAGIIVIGGTPTAHISILAKSLNIPVVFTNDARMLSLPNDIEILMDGKSGNLFIEPEQKIVNQYKDLFNQKELLIQLKEKTKDRTFTKDGVNITLLANLNLISELTMVKELKAEGIGLYRSEFPFIIRNSFPSEEEQFRVYRRIFEQMNKKEVTLRTLDVGGDKMLSYYSHDQEANPFLGLRAIRFTLKNRDIFIQQLRAMLRAGNGYSLRILFPLISSLDDFLEAKKVVEDVIEDLSEEKIEHNQAPQIGAMIELPSAALIADDLAQCADFISIGTNDLIQYTLGVDRTNESIADLFVNHHPAVIKLLKQIVDKAISHGCQPTICGEMGADPQMIPFLIGIGIRKFSLSPNNIPFVQEIISKVDIFEATKNAEAILKMKTLKEVSDFLNRS